MCSLPPFPTWLLSYNLTISHSASATLTFSLILSMSCMLLLQGLAEPVPTHLFPWSPYGHLVDLLTSLVLCINVTILKKPFISIFLKKEPQIHTEMPPSYQLPPSPHYYVLIVLVTAIAVNLIYISLARPWCPDIWSNIIRDGRFCEGVLNEINSGTSGLRVKPTGLHTVGGPHPIG